MPATKKRLIELDRMFEIGTPQPESKDELIEGLAGSKAASFRKVVEELGRDATDPMKLWSDELKLVYRVNAPGS